MPVSNINEPYEISARFFRALQDKALNLDAEAEKDAAVAASLEHPDHIERHYTLVRAQREKARLMRNFLAHSTIRVA